MWRRHGTLQHKMESVCSFCSYMCVKILLYQKSNMLPCVLSRVQVVLGFDSSSPAAVEQWTDSITHPEKVVTAWHRLSHTWETDYRHRERETGGLGLGPDIGHGTGATYWVSGDEFLRFYCPIIEFKPRLFQFHPHLRKSLRINPKQIHKLSQIRLDIKIWQK